MNKYYYCEKCKKYLELDEIAFMDTQIKSVSENGEINSAFIYKCVKCGSQVEKNK